MKNFVARALLFFLFYSPVFGKDLTRPYLVQKNYFSKLKTPPDYFFKMLRPYKILLIPGVLSESFFKESNQKLKVNFIVGEIFNDHEEFLKSHKMDYKKLVLESEQSPQFNSFEIEKAILKSKKKLILFSHSKGGLDTLMAIKRNPALLKKIKGWVTVQTPFYGSSVAEFFMKFKVSSRITKWLFELLGGNIHGLTSLTSTVRENFMNKKENQQLIKKILKNIKLINFTSHRPNTPGWDSPLELFRNYASFKKGKNDGVVHLKSGRLQGADYIIEKNVDHLLTVVNCNKIKTLKFSRSIKLKNKWPYDRVSHLQALLYLIAR
ncbi:hypothetical protein OAK75_07955 [Bacteriovoracales bacterium]|nr:hypothetical protein [Bacteriovoracales bacterium]